MTRKFSRCETLFAFVKPESACVSTKLAADQNAILVGIEVFAGIEGDAAET
jgi:hypothetical protein